MSYCSFANDQQVLNLVEGFNSRLRVSQHVNRINIDDISILSCLGRGSFSSVLKVRVPCYEDENDSSRSQQFYALKCLTVDKLDTDKEFLSGIYDMVCEAEILSRINHRNIIKLQGVSSQCAAKAHQKNDGIGYFFLLEILYETLDQRFNKWRKSEPSSSCNLVFRYQHQRKTQAIQMSRRIESVAMGLASAMSYLHEQQIVYRDIKPRNIGFDISGTVKLFDFGLARYIDDKDFNREEIAGTFRYMAPETMIAKFSGCPSDVYSFGILLWEVCTLRIPFDHLTISGTEDFKENVVHKHKRPVIGEISHRATRRLIKACWDPSTTERPTFSEICIALSDICTSLNKTYTESLSSSPARTMDILPKSPLSEIILPKKLCRSGSIKKVRDLLTRSDSARSGRHSFGSRHDSETAELSFHDSATSEEFLSLPF